MLAVTSHDDDFIADLDIRYIGHIDHALVHTDITRDRRNYAVNEHFCLRGIRAWITVRIAEREGRNLARSLRNKFASVTDRKSNRNFLEVHNVRLDGHHRFDGKFFHIYLIGRITSIKDDARTARVKVHRRKFHHRRAVRQRAERDFDARGG